MPESTDSPMEKERASKESRPRKLSPDVLAQIRTLALGNPYAAVDDRRRLLAQQVGVQPCQPSRTDAACVPSADLFEHAGPGALPRHPRRAPQDVYAHFRLWTERDGAQPGGRRAMDEHPALQGTYVDALLMAFS